MKEIALSFIDQHWIIFAILLFRGLVGFVCFPIQIWCDDYCKARLGAKQYADAAHMGGNVAWRRIDNLVNFVFSIRPAVIFCAILIAGRINREDGVPTQPE